MKKISVFISLTIVLSAFITLPVQADEAPSSSLGTAPAAETAAPIQQMVEPIIRVGLRKVSDPVVVTVTAPYHIFTGVDDRGAVDGSDQIVLSYDSDGYHVKTNEQNINSTEPIRLVPNDANSLFNIADFTRRLSGRQNNFNVYRGILEYRYSPRSQMPYLINELPLEAYLAGVTETSDDAPEEYLKALAIAERTYAYTNIAPLSPRHVFDVYASTVDQLYLGYHSEVAMPRMTQAVEDTAGQMVLFDNHPVTTYFFGHSDGRTRPWKEKGKLTRPWLQGVEAVYDKGMRLWGHGVGMSCHDALVHAKKDAWTAEQILKYYYTGIQIEREY